MNADKSLFYRFSGGYLNTGGFVDFSRAERVHVNPSVAWHPDEDTTFVADVEYYNQDYRPTLGLTINPFNTTRPADVPVSRNLEGPYVPLSNNNNVFVGSDFTHRFNDMFTFKQRFLAAFLHHDDAYSSHAGVDAIGNVLKNAFSQQNDSDVYGTNLDLLGHFDFLGAHHDTLLGFDYQRVHSIYGNQGRFFPPNPLLTVNMFYPWTSNVYTSIPTAFYDWQRVFDRPRFLNDRQANLSNQEGFYFQDHITLLDGKVHILGGGRFDWFWQGQARGSNRRPGGILHLQSALYHQSRRHRQSLFHRQSAIHFLCAHAFRLGLQSARRTSRPASSLGELLWKLDAGVRTERQRLGRR